MKAIKLRNEVRATKVMEMGDYLRGKEGKVVRLRDIVFATLANSMSNMMVSRDIVDIERECGEGSKSLMGFIKAMLIVVGTPSVGDLFPTLDGLLGFWERRKATKLHQEFKSLWGKLLKKEEKQNEMLAAGTSTTCAAIEWLMAELIKNQGVLHKLRHEIEMNDYVVPKDSVILINNWALGRDTTIWDEPLKFKPKRFLESKIELKGNLQFEFIPFGAGRMACPGLNVAATHVQGIVVLLVHCFDWFLPEGISPDDLNMTEKFETTVYMKEPLSLIPRSRT
ncbi:UNVERIFIED_CONTAM: putative (S)-N-methylcoclaurine 3'-hydroxylase isozyme 2 [Sesamum calycinum]|uniref:(S)-N-methylcoclaurine 3'-hydroxylase isozyme 2 n=1 Tax=Sesamum calycinum TaxID=2727403 RepID=A0AAW2N3H3_9LAMI